MQVHIAIIADIGNGSLHYTTQQMHCLTPLQHLSASLRLLGLSSVIELAEL